MSPESQSSPRGMFLRFTDAQAHARGAAALCADAARQGAARNGAASLAFSGGTTPALFFECLAGQDVPWACVHVFFVDERCVPQADPRSNFLLARDALLSRVPLPSGRIWPMPGHLSPEEGAGLYEARLRRAFAEHLGQTGPGVPSFDFIHLGMGGDGHTASLFPGDKALGETRKLVTAVSPVAASPPVPRLTMTLPLLCAARKVLFLVAGADKARLAEKACQGPQDVRLPASLVRPAEPPVWFVLD